MVTASGTDTTRTRFVTLCSLGLTFVALQGDRGRCYHVADALQLVRDRRVLAVQFQQDISGGFRMQY